MSRWVAYAVVVGLAVTAAGAWGDGRALAETAGGSSDVAEFFDPAVVMPPAGSAEAAVRAHALAGRRSAACSAAQSALSRASEPVLSRLRWQVGHQCDDRNVATTALRALAASSHPLAPWARLDLAEALRSTDPIAAASLTAATTPDWAGAERARVVHALALTDAADPAAEVALREILRAADVESGAATVAMPLSALLRSRDTAESKLEALQLLRRVASRAPLTRVGREAEAMADTLLSTLPTDVREQHALASADDEQHRGRALFNAHRHDAAASVFAAVADRPGVESSVACAARVAQLRALSRMRDRRAELVALSGRVLTDCTDPESRAWSHYYAAQAMVRLADPTSAIAHFDQIGVDAPGHSLVDDALFKAAHAATDLGDLVGAQKRLRAIVDQHAGGDMRSLARFELAWRSRRSGDHVGALSELDALIAEGARESAEGVEGRAQYWRARSLIQLDRRDDAIAALRNVVLAAPLSYYGQQALARLAETQPALAVELAGTIATSADRPALLFRARPELREPAFQRATELLAVGEIERARQELSWCGALGEGADPELIWLVAALFDAAHAPAQANRIARDRLHAFTSTSPRGRGYALWRLGYPLAFAPIIDDAATEHGVPATFVRAVAREESAFDPNAMSSAGAYGLIQLMEATAREHAKALKLPSDPVALRRPEVNVRIGASFMRYLWKRYSDNPAVVPAAYNAGHGAADRWLRERADQSLDEWIENIPYDETRRYTRRVLQSYGVYAMLDDGRLPALRALLPTPR